MIASHLVLEAAPTKGSYNYFDALNKHIHLFILISNKRIS